MNSRRTRLRSALARARLDAFITANRPNVRYVCGFSGSSGALLVTDGFAALFTDSRYTLQASGEVEEAAVETVAGSPLKHAFLAAPLGARVGFECDHMSVAAHQELSCQSGGRVLVPTTGLIESLRVVKDAAEIDRIAASLRLTSESFEAGLAAMGEGVRETEVAAVIEDRMRRLGADGPAFESIVASGPRGALPHGRASAKKMIAGEAVVVDIGAMLEGYASDMSRTVFLGEAEARGRRVYAAVLEAVRRAEGVVHAGAAAAGIHAAARGALEEAGFGDEIYRHGTGHGVGLEVHEAPRLSATGKDVLAAGMVLTIEPGVYVPGWGGVRIEDVVLVEETGCRVLTPTDKEIRAV